MSILKIGVIGCGNFGGAICNAAVKEGFECIAINASKRDLLNIDEKVSPFLVGDGKGTGKSREVAKEFLLDNMSIFKNDLFDQFVSSHDVICVAFSLGGGYGSGSEPTTVDILSQIYEGKCFKILTTFPSIAETYEAQNHTEQAMQEILELGVQYVIYDNDNFKDLEANEMNKKIISKAIEDLKNMRGDWVLETTTGGVDERDLMTVNSAPGRTVCCVIDNFEESMIEDDSIVATIKKQLANSANAAIVDDKNIQASAVIYNLKGDLKKYGAAIASELQTTFGAHLGDFRNEVVDNEDHEPFVACILSGLTEPTTRIDKVISRRMSIEKEITERQAASTKLGNVAAGKLSLSQKSFSTTKKDVDKDEILKKFLKK